VDRKEKEVDDPMGTDRLVLSLSAPAISRLIGGDTEVEIRLRHQVVDEFAKKHLRSVAAEPAFEAIIASHRKVIDAEVRDLVGKYIWKDNKTVPVLREKVGKLINDSVAGIVAEAAKRCFDKVIAEQTKVAEERMARYEGRLMTAAQDKFDKKVKELEAGLAGRIDEFFNQRVEEEAKRRLAVAASVPGAAQ